MLYKSKSIGSTDPFLTAGNFSSVTAQEPLEWIQNSVEFLPDLAPIMPLRK
jgi:hypothetical protein